jgi:GNAT superfamily N-acetyltransferase
MPARFGSRPLAASDSGALLALLGREQRLLGQPHVTHAMLEQCLLKQSPIDGGWWAELSAYRVAVLAGAGGLAGAVATAVSDDAGYVLWLAAGGDAGVQGQLLDIAVGQLPGNRPLRAFWFATALGAGLEGLPVRHAASLNAALLTRGFEGRDAWLYMHRDLGDITARPAARAVTTPGGAVTIRPEGDPPGCDVQGSLLFPELGIVSWLGVAPEHRGHGLGRQLLDAMLGHLRHLGAREVIL